MTVHNIRSMGVVIQFASFILDKKNNFITWFSLLVFTFKCKEYNVLKTKKN